MKTPRRSASLLLLRHPDDPQVYRVERRHDAPFLGGYHAFPGGMAEADEAPKAAALRETWEEVGVRVPAERLQPIGRWMTPAYLGTPIETLFFAAWADDLAPTVPPGHPELAAGAWIRPAEALADWAAGRALLAPPTRWFLEALADGATRDPARFTASAEAQGEPPVHGLVRPHIDVFPVRTPTLPPATHTGCYVVGTDALLVFDPASPWPAEQARLLDHLARRRAEGARVEAIVLTHHHHDHVGGARALADAVGAPIWAHRETASRVDFAVDALLDEGDVLAAGAHRLDVLHTPGHAPGHLCFVDGPTRSAIVGDMVAGVGTILIEPGDGDMAEYLRQLARLEALDLTALLPAHGPALADGPRTLRRYITHRLMREDRVLAAVRGGQTTVEGLVEVAYADAPPMTRMGPGGGLAGLSLRAHLEKLVAEGRVVHGPGGYTVAA